MSRRVLHVAQPAEGGVPAVVLGHTRAQVVAGWQVVLACPGELSAPAGAPAPGVEHVPWASQRLPDRSLLAEVRTLAALVARVDPDVVHLHSAKAGLVGRLAVRGRRPTVFQPHAWSFHAASGPVRAATLQWERRAARWADRLLCVSRAEQEEGVAAGVTGTYAVVPNGIDLSHFPVATASERASARQRLAQPGGPLVVCVGRLARQKGQDVLLAAWPRVRAHVPDARLVLVGDGPERAALEGRCPPGAEVHGASEDVAAWYRAADVVAVPSRWEGMALVPLEAAATGRSVVASRVAGMQESVADGAGALVPVEDVDALAGALTARLRDPALADAEGAAGRRFVEQEHDLGRVTSRVMDLYEDVLTPAGRRSRR